MISFLISLMLSVVLLFACTDNSGTLIPAPNPGKLDDEEVISFKGTLRTESTDWYKSEDGFTQLAAFNKADYPQAKRAAFATAIRTSSVQNKVFAQLYNVTDSVRIACTELTSNCECFRWVETEDILNKLPNKPVILGQRIRAEKEGFFVMTSYNSSLTMYNK